MAATIDVLIPTYNRPAALAVTLTSLIAQSLTDFRVIVSDQTEEYDATATGEIQAVLRVLQLHGQSVQTVRHLPRRGLAEHRQSLLDHVSAPYALFLDDDIILERDLLERLHRTIVAQGCGFVGSAVIGLAYAHISRPHEEAIEWWEGRVVPETVRPGTPAWERHRLHSACNLLHVAQRLSITPENERVYKVAWVGGCVLYDTAKLRAAGGFGFWTELPPEHCGEDVLAQLRVMERFGGCGLIPSGAYHQDLPTTVTDRSTDAPKVLAV